MPLDSLRSLMARWPAGEPAHVGLLREAGIEYVLEDDPSASFRRACHEAGIPIVSSAEVTGLVEQGLWPGVSRGPNVADRGDETASASREPWVDANGYLAHYYRALRPQMPVVLAYQPRPAAGLRPERVVPFASLELGLVEARINGANFVLAVEPRYRQALVSGDPQALAAWRSLAHTARWLREHAALFGLHPFPTITALVDAGAATREIANLLFRRGASPRLVSVSGIGKPDPQRILALVAAGMGSLPPAAIEHAAAGTTVVTDAPTQASWRLIKADRDRDFFAVGKGQVVAYHRRIADPSEFALDVIDIVTHRRRAARLWNAPAAIAVAAEGPSPWEALLYVVNYGAPVEGEVQARIQGRYSRALLLRPGAAPAELKVYHRNTMTEVFLGDVKIVAVVRFLR